MKIGTHDDWVLAAGLVGRCGVASVPNVGDAASPVTIHLGDHTSSAGQMADYRHNFTLDNARSHGAKAIVSTAWDGSGWSHGVEGIDTSTVAERVREIVRNRQSREASASTSAWANEIETASQARRSFSEKLAAHEPRIVRESAERLGVDLRTPGLRVQIAWYGPICNLRFLDTSGKSRYDKVELETVS